MRPSEINNAYAGLLSTFSRICNSANFVVKWGDTPGYIARSLDGNTHVVESLLHLSKWGFKPSSRKRSVHILVRSNEIFDWPRTAIVKSNIQLMYYHVEDDAAEALFGIHFDYERDVQKAHPVFHAQFGATKLSKEEREAIGFRYEIDNSNILVHPHLRVPTPHMGLSSVLLTLSADHLPDDFHGQFLKAVRGSKAAKWTAACPALKKSMGGYTGDFHCYHWY